MIAGRLLEHCPAREGRIHCWHPMSNAGTLTYHGPRRVEVYDRCCWCKQDWREISAVYDEPHEHGPHNPDRPQAA